MEETSSIMGTETLEKTKGIVLDAYLRHKCELYLIGKKVSQSTKDQYMSIMDSLFTEKVLTQSVYDSLYKKKGIYRAVLKLIKDTCIHNDLPTYPYKNIDSVKEGRKLIVRYSEKEILDISNKIEDYGLLIRTAYYVGGGLRFSSVILLKWEDFKWEQWLKDRQGVGRCDVLFVKRGEQGQLDVDPLLMEELHALAKSQGKMFNDIPFKNCRGNPYIFISDVELKEMEESVKKENNLKMLEANGEEWLKADVKNKALNMMIKKMHQRVDYKLLKLKSLFGDKKIKFHSIRHSKSTNLLKMGFKILDIQKMLMHKNLSTTELYVDVAQEDITSKYNDFVKNRKKVD